MKGREKIVLLRREAIKNMRLKDYFASFLEYKKKEGCTEHTLKEYQRFLFGAISHAEVPDKKKKINLDKIFGKK